MNTENLETLRYPVGRFARLQGPLDVSTRAASIAAIEAAPAALRGLAGRLDETSLARHYRPGGWTIRQVVHHVADSHMNAYVRMKLASTEDTPSVRGYDEALWAELPEAREGPVQMSLDLIDALHRRWVMFLRALPEPGFARAYRHSELGLVPIDEAVALYAWHGRHHAAHVELALRQS